MMLPFRGHVNKATDMTLHMTLLLPRLLTPTPEDWRRAKAPLAFDDFIQAKQQYSCRRNRAPPVYRPARRRAFHSGWRD